MELAKKTFYSFLKETLEPQGELEVVGEKEGKKERDKHHQPRSASDHKLAWRVAITGGETNAIIDASGNIANSNIPIVCLPLAQAMFEMGIPYLMRGNACERPYLHPNLTRPSAACVDRYQDPEDGFKSLLRSFIQLSSRRRSSQCVRPYVPSESRVQWSLKLKLIMNASSLKFERFCSRAQGRTREAVASIVASIARLHSINAPLSPVGPGMLFGAGVVLCAIESQWVAANMTGFEFRRIRYIRDVGVGIDASTSEQFLSSESIVGVSS
ncbi:hypothetical protein BDZ97DRAFT_1762452 [Flammula alnicola]|nr:hypothetical protein BDZ97DRAFT_1762452 [Flammula alnicola]